eukprot:scaffold76261_cov33-Tisochrysis_lutea.AAC.5
MEQRKMIIKHLSVRISTTATSPVLSRQHDNPQRTCPHTLMRSDATHTHANIKHVCIPLTFETPLTNAPTSLTLTPNEHIAYRIPLAPIN